MDTIYVVYKNNDNIISAATEDRAKELVDKLTRLQSYNNEFLIRLQDECTSRITASMPEIPIPEKPVLGKFSTGNMATYKAVKTLHNKNTETWQLKYNGVIRARAQRQQIISLAEAKWSRENYNPPSDLIEVLPYCKPTALSHDGFSYEAVAVL